MNDLNSSCKTDALPKVAIVGRPNVGKSTLFNRLLGTRKAITDEMPGVTRDPVESVCRFKNKEFILVDTGGYRPDESEEIGKLVTQRSIEVIEQAHLVMLVLDAVDVTLEDEIIIEKLRPYSKKIVLIANKIDSAERENLIWNFYKYGFTEVIGVSAAHGRNYDELERFIVRKIPDTAKETERPTFSEEEKEKADSIRLAILGKPNTGKSTLANLLTKTENSIVSEIPGTTRDIIEGAFHYNGYDFYIADTAGIRRKRNIHLDVEYYSVNRAIKTLETVDIAFLLVDAQEGLTDQDKKIATQIVKHGRGVVLVLTKWDIMPNAANLFQALSDRTRFFFPVLSFAPIVAVSAKKRTGIKKLLDTAVSVHKQLLTRIETAVLNKRLEEWVRHYEPPSGGRNRYKIRYLTHVHSNPSRFVAFVNRKEDFPRDYISYIKNRIRRDFHLDLIPFSLELREKK